MKRRFAILAAAFTLLAFLVLPMGMRAAEGDVHDMNITQSTLLNNNAAIPSISILAQSYPVSAVTINWRYNKTIENPVTIEVIVDGTSWGTQTITGNTTADAVFEGESVTGAIEINFTNNTGSGTGHGTFYVNSVMLTEGAGGIPPTYYTVTFDAGDGTFVGSTNLPNTSNTVTAGSYTLPTATREGYTFDGWMIEGDTELYNGSYTVSSNVDFTASYTEDTPPTPGDELTLTFDVSTNPGGWPTTNSNDLENYIYTLNGVDYTFALLNAKCNSGYLMIYSGGAVGLPAIQGYKLAQVVASNSGGCSTSTKVGISSSATQANYITGGEIQTWSTTSSQYTYNLTSTEENTMYYLYVTNKNAQVTSLALTYELAVAPTVATPTFDPVSGTEFGDEGLQVTISCATDGVDIYYTLDGSDPDDESIPYSGSITLTETTTIKAIAYDGNDNTSNVATATYTYVDPNAPGTENNPYTVAQARAAIDAGTGTQGVYATGIVSAIPTAWNGQYSNITFNFVDNTGDTDFLQAYRCVSGTGVDASQVAVGDVVVVYGNLTLYNTTTYEFAQGCTLVSLTHPTGYVEAPTFSPAAGVYDEAQNVTISCATAGANIYYTMDGTEPTSSSLPYSSAIPVSTTTTIKAIAYVGTNVSAVASSTYYISVGDISGITEVDAPYMVKGTVVATNSRGYVIGDGTGYVYVYLNAAPTVAINDMVTVAGITGTYGQIIQFTNSAIITESTTSNYNGTPAATVITEVPDYTQGYHLSTYLEFEGALTKSSGNYLITLGEAQIQISYPTTEQGDALTALNNKNVHVKGYFSGINSSGKFTVMLESVEEVEVQHEEYTLTVENLVNVNTYVFAGDESEMLFEGEGSAQILDGTEVMISVDVEEGYALQSLMVDGEEHASDIEGGMYIFEMPTHNVTVSATAVAFVPSTYTLTTTIESGKTYIIVGQSNSVYYAMGEQTTNNRAGVEISVEGDVATVGSEGVVEVVIEGNSTDGYTINDGSGYLYAASSNKNWLRTQEENDNNGIWTITFNAEDNSANVVANGENTHNHMKFNQSDHLFSCYLQNNNQHPVYLYVKDEVTEGQTIELSAGWNWISTYIDLNEVNGMALLKEALGDYGVTIQTYSESADYFGDGEWSGLEEYEWTNAEMIMVEVTEDCTITLAGPTVDPSTVEIEIYPTSWNWIGFPVATETAIEVAMAGFEAEEEDAIQSNVDGTSDYMDEWLGDVMTLVPGQGYMYYSMSTDPEPKILVFQTGDSKARRNKPGKFNKK